MTRATLTELANQHASDKGTFGPSEKWPVHNYSDVYEAYLHRFRDDKINLLEIGLGVTGDNWHSAIVHGRNTGGASLKMWHDYFPQAKIFGLDINSCPQLDNDRITTYVGHQGKLEDLQAFTKDSGDVTFDLIFDDGSHKPDDQQISFSYFFKLLKPGGIYFIEDLMANGKGDEGSGRCYCGDVVNTRQLFKGFRDTGKFQGPNLLTDADELANSIEAICFHSPKISLNVKYRWNWRRPFKPRMSYLPESERVCMIRKRSDA